MKHVVFDITAFPVCDTSLTSFVLQRAYELVWSAKLGLSSDASGDASHEGDAGDAGDAYDR